jgi:Flp pilus assembly protein TadD
MKTRSRNVRRIVLFPALVTGMFALGGCASWLLPDTAPSSRVNTRQLDRVLAENPDNVHAQFLSGKALLDSGQPKEAIPHFRRAVELKSSFEEAWIGLGTAQLSAGDLKGAQKTFVDLAGAVPDSPAPHEGLAAVALARGEFETVRREAGLALSRATVLGYRSAEAHRFLGEAEYAEGNYAEALAHWNAAVEIDPGLRTSLGPIMDDLEQYQKKYPQAAGESPR